MATVDVAVPSAVPPERAWKLASDLHRFDEWLTIFGDWRSPVPLVVREGTQVSSLIKVKGFRNTIHWNVTNYDAPKTIEMRGHGRGGIGIGIKMRVEDENPGSCFRLKADISGGLLNGPVGRLVAKVLEGEVQKSVENLAALA
jgi:carbon monoxide dehydrogenase subunit G